MEKLNQSVLEPDQVDIFQRGSDSTSSLAVHAQKVAQTPTLGSPQQLEPTHLQPVEQYSPSVESIPHQSPSTHIQQSLEQFFLKCIVVKKAKKAKKVRKVKPVKLSQVMTDELDFIPAPVETYTNHNQIEDELKLTDALEEPILFQENATNAQVQEEEKHEEVTKTATLQQNKKPSVYVSIISKSNNFFKNSVNVKRQSSVSPFKNYPSKIEKRYNESIKETHLQRISKPPLHQNYLGITHQTKSNADLGHVLNKTIRTSNSIHSEYYQTQKPKQILTVETFFQKFDEILLDKSQVSFEDLQLIFANSTNDSQLKKFWMSLPTKETVPAQYLRTLVKQSLSQPSQQLSINQEEIKTDQAQYPESDEFHQEPTQEQQRLFQQLFHQIQPSYQKHQQIQNYSANKNGTRSRSESKSWFGYSRTFKPEEQGSKSNLMASTFLKQIPNFRKISQDRAQTEGLQPQKLKKSKLKMSFVSNKSKILNEPMRTGNEYDLQSGQTIAQKHLRARSFSISHHMKPSTLDQSDNESHKQLNAPQLEQQKIRKPLVCVEIKILEVVQRIEVFKEDNLVEVVGLFCKKHGLTLDTQNYLTEKVHHYKTNALRKKEARKIC